MLLRSCVSMFVGGIILTVGANEISAQTYPNKPIRIVTAEAGGGADLTSRLIAQELSKTLGQQVIVDNRGGSATIAAQIVSKAPPDGYTLLLYGGTIWVEPLLQKSSYDPVKDFTPITLAVSTPNILVVHPVLPVKTVRELIALAKAKPGELNCAAGSTGSTSQLAAELFKSMAAVNLVLVPYKGTGPAVNALLGGQVQLMFPIAAAALPHLKTGRLRALAVTSAAPSALAPDLPTVAASGLPGYQATAPFSVFAPADTPASIVNLLNQEIARSLKRTEVRERLFSIGVEPVGSAPKELADFIKADMGRIGKVIKDAGIRTE